jgi:hypothetical protein
LFVSVAELPSNESGGKIDIDIDELQRLVLTFVRFPKGHVVDRRIELQTMYDTQMYYTRLIIQLLSAERGAVVLIL